MNYNFGKPLASGGVEYAPSVVDSGSGITYNPSETTYNALGYFRMANNAPESRDGYTPVKGRYEVIDNKCVTMWDYQPIVRTMEDYNAALESHLRDEMLARGYDTREPSDYKDSSVERWRQDAIDWIAHRDAVMVYGLGILNEWKRTGVEPDYVEFVDGLPRIEWTIKDEEA